MLTSVEHVKLSTFPFPLRLLVTVLLSGSRDQLTTLGQTSRVHKHNSVSTFGDGPPQVCLIVSLDVATIVTYHHHSPNPQGRPPYTQVLWSNGVVLGPLNSPFRKRVRIEKWSQRPFYSPLQAFSEENELSNGATHYSHS